MTTLQRTLLAVATLVVIVPASAQAKGPASGRLCGESGCVTLQGWDTIRPFTAWWDTPFTERAAPRPAPFFRLVVTQASPHVGRKITWTLLYVPARNAMRISQSRVPPYSAGMGPFWRTIPITARAGLRRATAALTPFRPSSHWQAGG